MSSTTAPKPSARIRRKRRQVRLDILNAARRILEETGVEGVTLGAVAGKLAVTKQAIYHYFPSKNALVSGLVIALLDDEVETLIAAVEAEDEPRRTLGTLIRAFHAHYADRLDAFRTVYCQSQLGPASAVALSRDTLREEVNPRTRHLFDVLESRLTNDGMDAAQRQTMRRLAFTAWTSVLGLMTMLSIAAATNDPLAHDERALLQTLIDTYDLSAESFRSAARP